MLTCGRSPSTPPSSFAQRAGSDAKKPRTQFADVDVVLCLVRRADRACLVRPALITLRPADPPICMSWLWSLLLLVATCSSLAGDGSVSVSETALRLIRIAVRHVHIHCPLPQSTRTAVVI